MIELLRIERNEIQIEKRVKIIPQIVIQDDEVGGAPVEEVKEDYTKLISIAGNHLYCLEKVVGPEETKVGDIVKYCEKTKGFKKIFKLDK
jgi:hypothetical protein